MYDGSETLRQTARPGAGALETGLAVSVPVTVVAPPLRLAGTEEDEDEDEATIVRGID